MNDILQDAPAGPSSDALDDQVDGLRAVTASPEGDEPDPKAEPKPEPAKTKEQKRADQLRATIDKTLDAKPDAKADPKPEVKPEAKPETAADAVDAAKPPAREAKQTDDNAAPPQRVSAFKDAPSGFDDAAKREWEATPEGVRGAVHRRIREMESGLERSRQPAERYEKVFRQFDDIARQAGADPAHALSTYVALDRKLRTDLIGGLSDIVAAQGVRGPNGQPVTLRDIASHILGQTPDQNASRTEAVIQALQQELAQLKQGLGGVSQHVQDQRQEAQSTAMQGVWEQFTQNNPRAVELEGDMIAFMRRYPAPAGTPPDEILADALAFAASKAPQPIAAHTGNEALAQTQTPRQANPAGKKSVSGAPRGNITEPKAKLSRREAIEKSMRNLGI